MSEETPTQSAESTAAKQGKAENSSTEKERTERREIKGGLPYTNSPGVLKKALELIVTAERPDKFSVNYMETILKITGGSARAIPPFLKKMQFIGSDGSPTTLYSKFKTEGGRSLAAYEGLRNAFGETFRRNEYIHRADEATIKDIIVEITGLKRSDSVVRLVYASFDAVRSFISSDVGSQTERAAQENQDDRTEVVTNSPTINSNGTLTLSYQINIILPETENIAVFNAIFKSLRENLLR